MESERLAGMKREAGEPWAFSVEGEGKESLKKE